MLPFKQFLLKNFNLFLLAIGTFFFPIKNLLILVGVMIFGDTILGLLRARKKKEVITSRKLSNIISKFFLYEGAVILAYLLDFLLLGEFTMLFIDIEFLITKISTLTIVFVELKSLDENFKILSGFHFWEMFKRMLRRAEETKEDIKKIKK